MSNLEIFVLNYNGNDYLAKCLERLNNIDTASHSVNINLIDNKSPNPPDAIISQFPEVNYIQNSANLGFSKGNNTAVWKRLKEMQESHTPSDYLVFLNNDTEVEEDWLKGAVKAFDKDPKIGIVGSKSVFVDKFIKVSIKYHNLDSNKPGIFFHFPADNSDNFYKNRSKLKLNHVHTNEPEGYWFKQDTSIYLPVADAQKNGHFRTKLENRYNEKLDLEILINDSPVKRIEILPRSHKNLLVDGHPGNYRNIIQNAGSFIDERCNAGDIGFLEIDKGQRDLSREVPAICGVSLFIKTELFKELNGFDEKFFAYFEDVDLCLRAKKLGQKCFYEASSKLQHVHCGSGIEHSEYFNTNVSWSLLVFGSKYMNRKQWKEILSQYWKNAKVQFEAFQQDHSFLGKAQLRALGRYYKNWFYFKRNRFYKIFLNTNKLIKVESEQ